MVAFEKVNNVPDHEALLTVFDKMYLPYSIFHFVGNLIKICERLQLWKVKIILSSLFSINYISINVQV